MFVSVTGRRHFHFIVLIRLYERKSHSITEAFVYENCFFFLEIQL
jgi:hypothetical protein